MSSIQTGPPKFYDVYVDAEKLPDMAFRRKVCEPKSWSDSKDLEITASKYAISSDKPSRFTLKSISKRPHDVLVEVQSAIFKIIDARRSRGVTSQVFHVLEEDQSMTFEVGLKDLSNISYENLDHVDLTSPAGYMVITQVDSYKKDDSDESWGLVGDNKKKLAKIHFSTYEPPANCCEEENDCTCPKYCKPNQAKKKLFIEKDTEDLTKVKRALAEVWLKKEMNSQENWDKTKKKELTMFIPVEKCKKEDEDTRKMLQNHEKAVERWEKEDKEYDKEMEARKENQRKIFEKREKKEARKRRMKKCVIS